GKFAVGVSVEGPQATVGGRGFTSYQNTSANGTVTASQNFFINAPGAGGGLYNAFDSTGYSVNKAPDFIFKAAIDPGFGHYEVFGVVSTFRNRIFPCAVVSPNAGANVVYTAGTQVTCSGQTPGTATITTPSGAGAYNDTRTGGGFGASAHWALFNKKVDFGGYGHVSANNSGCSTETAPTGSFTPGGGGTCAGDTRFIQEGTLGFWHKFYQGPKGGMRWGLAYSYITRTAWSGAASNTPKAVDNMVWTSFRYYLP